MAGKAAASSLRATLPLLMAWRVSAITFPPENCKTGFRHDPRKFDKVWTSPPLLDGRQPAKEHPTDLTVYSATMSGETFWVDYLYPFQWEREWFYTPLDLCTRSTSWTLAWVAAVLYLIGLRAGISSMKDKQPYDLRWMMAAWNLFLATFSIIGTLRIVPHLYLMLWTYGLDYSLCRAATVSYGLGSAGLWVGLFQYSKYFELFDTVFLVLRKRKVGFLHWYHHCTVLLYSWNSYCWETPTGIFFVGMNFGVHAIMYTYYFLASVCRRPPKWGFVVTILQLSQMAGGIAVTLLSLNILISNSVPNCDGHIPNLTAALGMYASYFILFFQFLVRRYCQKRSNVPEPTCTGAAQGGPPPPVSFKKLD